MLDSERSRTLLAIIACLSAYGVTFGLTSPLLSLILETRGVDRTWIGLNAAMPAFSTILLAPFIPRIIARIGIHATVRSCIVLDCVFFFCLPVFDHLYEWMFLRFCLGATNSALFIASETWINQIAHEHARGRTIGFYSSVLAISIAIGPLIIVFTGIEGWAPFLVGGACIVASLLPLRWATMLFLAQESGGKSFSVTTFFRVAPALVAGILVFAIMEITTLALLPVYGVRSGQPATTAAVMLTVLGVGRIALQFPIGILADRVDRYRLLAMCIAGTGTATVLLPMVVTDSLRLVILLFFWGGLIGGIYTLALTLIGERFRGEQLTTANAGLGVLWGIGSLSGLTLTGVAMDLYDPHGFVATLVILCAAGLIVVLRNRPSTQEPV